MKPGRNHFFDILRVVSVLFVITSHYSYMFDTSSVLTFPREYLTAGIGRLGVSFFFMISGALAYLSLRKYAAGEYYLRRVYSVLIPYNIAYFGMALLLLALSAFFIYPNNPLAEVGPSGSRSVLDMLPSVLGFDHYLHGVYEIKTVYFTGEWFIGCIILLYAISPLIYRAMVRYPMWTMLATVAITLAAYDTRVTNPYWSAQVRISDFTFGMLFIHLQIQFTRYARPLALLGGLLITAGVAWAHLSHQTVREVLFPLAPVSLLFAVAFFFIVQALYQLLHPWLSRPQVSQVLLSLASRAYIIMLLQHVVVIFLSANLDMSVLNATQAIALYLIVLVAIERLSVLFKPLAVKTECLLMSKTLRRNVGQLPTA
ncbi:acyltransferase family protein [Edwardsiella tarda]|uniref:acyltransferase family protein n=1 Tax=Edwardsiella tarda TaxID=636 RepID=UPI00351C351E